MSNRTNHPGRHSALTLALAESINEIDEPFNYRQLVSRIRLQHPELEFCDDNIRYNVFKWHRRGILRCVSPGSHGGVARPASYCRAIRLNIRLAKAKKAEDSMSDVEKRYREFKHSVGLD